MKKILFTLILSIVSLICAAQTVSLSGVVNDRNGDPVIGALVRLQNNPAKATVTSLDGLWKLEIPKAKGSVLEISCMGYQPITVEAVQSKVADLLMEEASIELDEAVSIGYGSIAKSDLTGAVSSVKIDEYEADRSATIDQLIQGNAAGVSVVNNNLGPDAGLSIVVRGESTLNGSNQPLYVVDGVILSNESPGTELLQTDPDEDYNPLAGINPSDIAKIEILKDASSTAIYGAEGANGVVLITTKTAGGAKMSVEFNASLSYNTLQKKMDVLNFDEYVKLIETVNDTRCREILSNIYEDPSTHSGLKVTPVNWQDYSLQDVLHQKYHLAISGRPKETNYRFSVGYTDSPGILKTTGSKQLTANLTVSRSFFKNRLSLRVGAKFAYVYSRTQSAKHIGTSSNSMLGSILYGRPYMKYISSEEEEYIEEEETGTTGLNSGPYRWFNNAFNYRSKIKFTPDVSLTFKITPWLSFKSAFGLDHNDGEYTRWKGKAISSKLGNQGGISQSTATKWSWDNIFSVDKKLRRHHISGNLGLTMIDHSTTSQNVSGYQLLQSALQVDNLNQAYLPNASYTESRESKLSLFARAVYNYDERYIVTATYRMDGSSKFSGSNKFGHFPSAALAWRINQEHWFDVPVISQFKLRAGWGLVGNSSLSNYVTVTSYSTSNYPDHFNDAGYVTGIEQAEFPNEDLRWETTEQWNAGLDFAMFKGRLAFNVDAYYKTTYDLLQNKMVPYASGFSNRWVNQGTIVNKGLEFTLDVVPVKTRMVELSIDGNLSLNRNTLADLGFEIGEKTIYTEPGVSQTFRCYEGGSLWNGNRLNGPANIFIEGQELGLFYGYKTDGIIQEGETGVPLTEGGTARKPGQINYVDMNQNGYIDEDDKTIIGSSAPDFSYGFGFNLRVQRFILSARFRGVFGRQLFNAANSLLMDSGNESHTNVLRVAVTEAWTKDNPSDKIPGIDMITDTERLFVSDYYIEDASYLKLSNVSLSYDFKMPKKCVVAGLSVNLYANNLFVATNYSGWDVTSSTFGVSMTRMGIDQSGYPPSMSFGAGVKIKF